MYARGRWNNYKRKQQTSNNFVYNEDPFAGMNASVDYQKEIERLKKQTYTKPTHKPVATISRSTTPDSSSSSESDISEASTITEEEKVRFLAFIRSWTGDCQNNNTTITTTSSSSFWSDPSPWNSPIKQQSSVSTYPIPVKNSPLNHHPLPIGTKRQL